VSQLGDAVTTFSLAWAVLDLTGSTRDPGFVLAANTDPLVIFLLAGGVFADRLPRRGVMLAAAPLASSAAPRVCPDDERHAEPACVVAHSPALREVCLCRGRPDVERVADGVRVEQWHPQRWPAAATAPRRPGDVGLAVQLQDQRDYTRVCPAELLGQPDLDRDAVEAALDGKLGDVRRVAGLRVGEEIARPVLEALVVGQEQRCPVAQAELI
jgi:hypothetical protein